MRASQKTPLGSTTTVHKQRRTPTKTTVVSPPTTIPTRFFHLCRAKHLILRQLASSTLLWSGLSSVVCRSCNSSSKKGGLVCSPACRSGYCTRKCLCPCFKCRAQTSCLDAKLNRTPHSVLGALAMGTLLAEFFVHGGYVMLGVDQVD